MANVKFEKGSKEWHMFQDYWKICQKFWLPEEKDEYWDAVVKEVGEFHKKYENIILSKEIALAFLGSLEKKDKEKRGDVW